MRRIILACTLLLVFALGVVFGSMFIPAARAQDTTTTTSAVPIADNVQTYPAPYTGYGYLTLPRWVIVPVAAPGERGSLTMLIDTTTGDTFYLATRAGVGYYWARIIRG